MAAGRGAHDYLRIRHGCTTKDCARKDRNVFMSETKWCGPHCAKLSCRSNARINKRAPTFFPRNVNAKSFRPMVVAACLVAATSRAQQPRRPNIVLMFPDNLGWGEVGVYGSVRGVPTPRIDKLAAEGMRLNNFNVEYSCTVSRAALLTGRYAVRSGAAQPAGITLWESHDCRGAQAAWLRHRALRQMASGWQQLVRGTRAHRIRASTSGTESR